MVYKMWKQECGVRGLFFSHHTPEDFTRCHWQKEEKVTAIWIAYRALMALYFLGSFIYTSCPIFRKVSDQEITRKYIIFLTHWTYILETAVFVLGLIIVAVKAYQEDKKPSPPMDKMPWYYKLYWIMYTIVLPSAVMVSIIFWLSVYDPELFPATPGNLIEHLFNSVFITLDFILIAHPIKFLHFYLPAAYAFLYGGFSMIYQLSGGTGVKGIVPIYKILDWRYPWKAILTCFLTLLFLMFLHFTFSLLTLFKVWIKKRKENETLPVTH